MVGLMAGFLITGCAALVSTATKDLAENLSKAILDNDDPAMVETGGPAHLLMIDGLLQGNPNDEALLQAAATLYTAYTAGFVNDQERAKILTDKALAYGFRTLCRRKPVTCGFRKIEFQKYMNALDTMKRTDVPALYALGISWAGWVEAHKEDWNAVAELSRIEEIMKRIVELDEFYQDGGAHLYLGTFATLIPPALGGKPKIGQHHFERALEISDNKNLMIKVVYAKQYARLVFDRDLHDQLLNEVLDAEARVPGYTLINTLAKQQAQELLADADNFF